MLQSCGTVTRNTHNKMRNTAVASPKGFLFCVLVNRGTQKAEVFLFSKERDTEQIIHEGKRSHFI